MIKSHSKALLPFLFLFFISYFADAQKNRNSYTPPTEAEVQANLENWRDLKFGMIIHWGLYSVPGIVESWSICAEDVDWIPRDSNVNYNDYKNWYWGLNQEFKPEKFDPEQWASVARNAGMKYLIFTMKHHDGFAMYDTRFSDFSIAQGPFRNHPKNDVAKWVFDAFRHQDMKVGAYFSKPDWHSQNYWWNRYATPDRHVNYDIAQHPQRWNDFKQFVHNQIDEITSRYGKLDILWLDGGWVCPPDEDIDMAAVSHIARRNQPGILIVDRTVGGANENYQTPEKTIPDQQRRTPWETCIPLSKDWGYVPDADFKSAKQIIEMLMEVVAKGGSLLLGIGPSPQGLIEERECAILNEIGQWLQKNGEAIYNTRCADVYHIENMWFTNSKNGKYAYLLCPSATENKIYWSHFNLPRKGSNIVLLDTHKKLSYFVTEDGKIIVNLPKEYAGTGKPLALKIEVQEPVYQDLNKNRRCDAYENSLLPIDLRVADLLSQMTVDEKIGQLQMTMGWGYYERAGKSAKLTETFAKDILGQFVGGTWALMRADPWTQKTFDNGLDAPLALQVSNEMQRQVRENTRLGIPLLIAEECPHGLMALGATTFPTALGRASSFDRQLEEEIGQCVGNQLYKQGGNVAFGPVVDVARDPRWSRMEEGYGEDPVLSALMGNAYAHGLTQQPLWPIFKHFSAYGVSEGGHNGASAHLGANELFALSYPFFFNARYGGVMTAYNDIDGIPCSANKYLINNVLRDSWHFDGLVISDLYAINGLVSYRVAADKEHAAALALKAGVDIDLGASCYSSPLKQALEEQLITMVDIDSAVAHVLKVKFKLGLFDKQYDQNETEKINDDALSLSRKSAEESIVLLKNDHLLPLSKDLKRVAVIGPNADNVYNLLGDYTAPQAEGKVVTLLDGIRRKLPQTRVDYVQGCAIRDTSWNEIEKAVAVAREADVVILALGGSSARDFQTSYQQTGAADAAKQTVSDMECGEGFDRATLSLLGHQEALMHALAATGKPIVLVMVQGRPLNLNWASEHIPAIITAWYPGDQGGNALADILFGDVNPSGKLPLSYPRSVGQLPVYYNANNPRHNYTDGAQLPLYPFGYGLSYTTFAFDDFQAERRNDSVFVSVTLTNTGLSDGAEVVQLYARNDHAQRVLPERQLIDFQRVFLKKGESKSVRFSLSTDAFSILDIDLSSDSKKSKNIKMTLMLGTSSQDIKMESVIY